MLLTPTVSSVVTVACYNQPDHELIDRTDRDVQRMLLRLARCHVAAAAARDDIKVNGDWHAALSRWGLPAADSDPLTVEGATMPPLAWRTRLAAAANAKACFLELLDRFGREGRNVSDRPGPTYAPSTFAREREANVARVGKSQLDAAVIGFPPIIREAHEPVQATAIERVFNAASPHRAAASRVSRAVSVAEFATVVIENLEPDPHYFL
jgi:hypothetical protein